jgi:hypothetical protein
VRRRHPLHRLARAQERAGDIGGEDAADPRRVDRVHTRLRLEDAGVVDQRAQRTETLVDRLEEPEDIGFAADVGADSDRRAAARFDVGDHGIGRRAIRSIVDADGVAALGREAGGRGADTAATASHQDRH